MAVDEKHTFLVHLIVSLFPSDFFENHITELEKTNTVFFEYVNIFDFGVLSLNGVYEKPTLQALQKAM